MAVLGISFPILLAILAILEIRESNSATDWARSDFTIRRLTRVKPIIENLREDRVASYVDQISHCHNGYTITDAPFAVDTVTTETKRIAKAIAMSFDLDRKKIKVGNARLNQSDFSYSECALSEMDFPIDGMVISLNLTPDQWLNVEVHPHEWHFTQTMTDWLVRSGAAFMLIGVVALLFVRRFSKPIKSLTGAAKTFGSGLEVAEVEETGPPDVKRAIRSFNAMQREVSDEVKRRTNTLAAISHDIRSPLTALRVKAELIDDEAAKADLIASIAKMERITASALAFLQGESRNEPMRQADLCVLVESECQDFIELGAPVSFNCPAPIQYACRPDALARAVRNLIENAVKYAGAAAVSVKQMGDQIEIVVSDHGPGIPEDKLETVLEPFERLSDARESKNGGFGLGLAIAKAVTDGHDGVFELRANSPTGLVVIMRLPLG